ncbi:MAG: hypothetical protein QOI02_256 [Actinomycetota bacterium]|nr:hypothetical protein [Actinomycetota bacterium]
MQARGTPELLLDVAALLFTSALLGSHAEVSSAPAQSVTAPAPAVPGTQEQNISDAPSPLLLGAASDPIALPRLFLSNSYARAAPLSEVASMAGTDLLHQLAIMPQTTLSSFIRDNPSTVQNLLTSPPKAANVTSWWGTLNATEQQSLVSTAPEVVGNLDGIPTALRDTANRAWIAQKIQTLNATVATDAGRASADTAEHRAHMLAEVRAALVTTPSQPERQLLSVNPDGSGRAAIVLGDIATADYVTYLVPGMFFQVDGQINDWTDVAARYYDEQVAWLKTIQAVQPDAAHKTVAVVSWMGYQTPDLTNIGSLDLAYEGRDAIAHAIQGLQAERAGNEPYVTVVAHSYGSTAVLMALTQYDFSIDALAVVGSPGSAAQSVHDLHVRGGNVYVGEAAWDPVPNSSWFGSDPGSAAYGAKPMDVKGTIDPILGTPLLGSVGHNDYFAPGSESFRNMALVGLGEGQLVTTGSTSDAATTLAMAR